MSSVSAAQPQPAPGLPRPHEGGGAKLDEPKVLVSQTNSLHHIILNREKAINALDTDMIKGLSGALSSIPPETSLTLLRPTPTARGLCSGGDVLKVVNMANDPSTKQGALDFFQEEFEVDWKLAKMCEEVTQGKEGAKAVVSFMDGITMGGGVGLSVHAPFRVATEKTLFAMPETGIGYFPDVGVTRVLSRLDGHIGLYLGMTGARISGRDAYLAGLATHYVPSSSLPKLTEALEALPAGVKAKEVAKAIEGFGVDPNEGQKEGSVFEGEMRGVIDFVFGKGSVREIFKALEELASSSASDRQSSSDLSSQTGINVNSSITKWAQTTLTTLQDKAPRSLVVTLHTIRHHQTQRLDIDASFRHDMRLATAFCDLSVGRDFYEGVHHVLTKDPSTGKRREGRAPWQPGSVEEVDEGRVKEVFFGDLAKAGLSVTVPELTALPSAPSKPQQPQAVGPLKWEPSFNAFHPLPSEAEMEALLQGSHPAAGSFQIDLEDEDAAVKEIVGTLGGWKSSRYGGQGGGEVMVRKVRDWVRRRRARGGKA